MRLSLSNPTRIDIDAPTPSEVAQLGSQLCYHDKRVDHEIERLRKNRWMDEVEKEEKLAELKLQRIKPLLFQDEQGYYTYSGLRQNLENITQLPVEGARVDECHRYWPWAVVPDYEPRPYQTAALDCLLNAPQPAAVEIGTGLGKSYIALLATQRLGSRTLVMAPSTNIAKQLLRSFRRHLGTRMVGQYFDGKKELREVTIGNSQTLTRVDPASEAGKWFLGAEVFIADESHLVAADTLESVCMSLARNARWRFFFSGTQIRTDGLELLLRGIIGEVCYKMTVEEGVDQGWLAKPEFYMIGCTSESNYSNTDAQRMSRVHLLENPRVLNIAADLANNSYKLLRRPTLILIEEYSQFKLLLPRLQVACKFAHGPLTKDTRQQVPPDYQDDNPEDLVDSFNRGEIPVLVGTSCISTGTDILPAEVIINLRGGLSEIEARQGVGRGTRKTSTKTSFQFFDFDVKNVPMLTRHAKTRAKIYRAIYPNLTETLYG